MTDTSRKAPKDPMELIIFNALNESNVSFVMDDGGQNPSGLDFNLLDYGVEIEVKQFHSPRIADQMSRAPNVIAAQGRVAVKFLADAIRAKHDALAAVARIRAKMIKHRETFCMASPGTDEEFQSAILIYDSCIETVEAEMELASAPVLYAKAGGPPDNWTLLEVKVDGVVQKYAKEANVTEGWADVSQTFNSGEFQRVYGVVEISVMKGED